MKCDELTPIELECNMGKDINGVEHREPWKAYDIDEVDAAIAELKEAWRSEHQACEALNAKLEDVQASAYADSVDAGMRELRLQRALYKTLALWANERARLTWSWHKEKGWKKMENKCLKKAEEYK